MGMKIDQYVNRFLAKVFGPEDAQGNRSVWFHSQNLNEDRKGNVKGFPWEGRCWLHSARRGHRTLAAFSWYLKDTSCGVSIGSDNEDGGTQFHWAFPPVSFWLTLPINLQGLLNNPFWAKWNEKYGGYKDSHRYTKFKLFDIRIFDWSLHWDLLKFDWGWSRQMPKWMDGHFNFVDALLGKRGYEQCVYEKREVVIPMPEGDYKAKAKLFDSVWTRSHLPFWERRILRVEISMEPGWAIPHPGKGENSWDCDDDATYGITCPARTIEEGIGKLVGSVLESRKKYGGPAKWPVYPPKKSEPTTEPPPEAEAAPEAKA